MLASRNQIGSSSHLHSANLPPSPPTPHPEPSLRDITSELGAGSHEWRYMSDHLGCWEGGVEEVTNLTFRVWAWCWEGALLWISNLRPFTWPLYKYKWWRIKVGSAPALTTFIPHQSHTSMHIWSSLFKFWGIFYPTIRFGYLGRINQECHCVTVKPAPFLDFRYL